MRMTLEGEDWFDNQYYGYIRRLLTIIGLWPYLELSKRLPYICFVSTLMFAGMYSQIYLMMISEVTVGTIIEFSQTLLPIFLFTFSYWNLLYHSELMKELFERVKNHWKGITCDHELSIMQTYGAQSKQYSRAITCINCSYILFLIIPSIFRLFLYIFGKVPRTELIVPVHHELLLISFPIFIISFSLELLMIFTTCVLGIALYTMFISFIQHACALLMFVTKEIDRPFVNSEYQFSWGQTSSKRKAEHEWIVAVVKNYNNAIEFVELIRKLYKKMSLIELLLGMCFIIIDFIYFLQLLDMVMSTGEILTVCFYSGGTLLIIFAYCHLGERLMEHSNRVYDKCRLVPVYMLSVQTNKLLMMLLIRSMKPCTFSIMGTIVSSHELLAKMMKGSFSFATVCYNVR